MRWPASAGYPFDDTRPGGSTVVATGMVVCECHQRAHSTRSWTFHLMAAKMVGVVWGRVWARRKSNGKKGQKAMINGVVKGTVVAKLVILALSTTWACAEPPAPEQPVSVFKATARLADQGSALILGSDVSHIGFLHIRGFIMQGSLTPGCPDKFHVE